MNIANTYTDHWH